MGYDFNKTKEIFNIKVLNMAITTKRHYEK